MSNVLRREVLKGFKSLHKTRKFLFRGDAFALEQGRKKINEEFKNNKHLTDNKKISELLSLSKEVEQELRTTVIQAKQIEPGRFEVNITSDTVKYDNIPYKELTEEEAMKGITGNCGATYN